MAYRFTFLFFAFSFVVAHSQPVNLVPNPGFEERSECQWNNGFIHHAPPWFKPTKGTPDVFHICGAVNPDPCPYPQDVFLDPWHFGVPTNFLGCQEPYEGDGYAGAFLMEQGFPPDDIEWREYLAVELTEPLEAGEIYDVSMMVSLSERSGRAVWAIEVAFLPELVINNATANHLPIEPSLSHTEGDFIVDKDGWTQLSWLYSAEGGEQYMYIGNFQSNLEIDTLFVLPAGELPLAYYVNSSYYYFDNVYVGTSTLGVEEKMTKEIQLWPNPAVESLFVKHATSGGYEIFDLMGKLLNEGSINSQSTTVIDVSALQSGMYVLKFKSQYSDTNSVAMKFIKR